MNRRTYRKRGSIIGDDGWIWLKDIGNALIGVALLASLAAGIHYGRPFLKDLHIVLVTGERDARTSGGR